MVPADKPPAPASRQIFGVSFPSDLGAGMSTASASAAKPADWIRVLRERLADMAVPYSSRAKLVYGSRGLDVSVGSDNGTFASSLASVSTASIFRRNPSAPRIPLRLPMVGLPVSDIMR